MARLGTAEVAYQAVGLNQLKADISGAEKAFKTGAAAMGAAVVAMGAAVIKFGTEAKQIESIISAQVGDVRTNMDLVKELFRDGFEGGIKEAGQFAIPAIRALGTETKIAIEDLKFGAAIAQQFQVDAPEMFSGVKTLMDEFKLTSGQALDFIAAGFQKGLDRSGDFLESINEYSVQFSNAGADAGEFFSLMETGLKGGVLGTDKAADAFKEFRDRIQDGSKATDEALAKIGLNASEITKELSTGGITITDAFQEVIRRLGETDDSVVQMQAGVGLLGTQFHDLGNEAILGLNLAKTGMDDLTGSAEAVNATTETARKSWNRLVNEGILIAVEIWDRYDDRIKDALDATISFAQDNKKVLADFVDFGVEVWDVLNVAFISYQDYVGRGFIEVQSAGELAWTGIKVASASVIEIMTRSFQGFVELAKKAAGKLGLDEMQTDLAKFSFGITQTINNMKDWAGSIEEVQKKRRDSIEIHNATIDAMISERAEYKNLGVDATAAAVEIEKVAAIEIKPKTMPIKPELDEKAIEAFKAPVKPIPVPVKPEIDKKEFEKAAKDAAKAMEGLVKDTLKAFSAMEKGKEALVEDWRKIDGDYAKDYFKSLEKNQSALEESLKDIRGVKELSADDMLEVDRIYGREYEEALEAYKGAYETFLEEQLGVKELSEENKIQLDQAYADAYTDLLTDGVGAFEEHLDEIGVLKELSVEELAKADSDYGQIFRDEQASLLQASKAEFYDMIGGLDEEMYAEKSRRLTEQYDNYKAALGDSAGGLLQLDKWYVAEQKKLNDERVTNWDSAATAMKDSQAFKDFQSGVSGAFRDTVHGLITGDITDIGSAWDSMWSSAVSSFAGYLSEMAAEWAARGVAEAAGWVAEALFAHDGMWEVGRGPGGAGLAPDEVPIIAQEGEMIIPAALAAQIRESETFEDFKNEVRSWFGADEETGAGDLSQYMDYSASAQQLLGAWNAYQAEDYTGMAIHLTDAVGQAMQTYGTQQGSQVVLEAGAGISDIAGAFGAGVGAYTAFEEGNYIQGTVQAAQALQSALEAYQSYVAAEAAASGTAAATTTATTETIGAALGDMVSSAGEGLMLWSAISFLSGASRMQSEEAQIGAVTGAVAGSYIPGIGSYAGAVMGGMVGGLFAGGPETFTLDELNAHINANRTIQDGMIGTIPAPDTSGHWYDDILAPSYYNAYNTQAEALNSLTSAITADLPPEMDALLIDAINNLPPVDVPGIHFNREEDQTTVLGYPNFYWNQAVDAYTAGIADIIAAGAVGVADYQIPQGIEGAIENQTILSGSSLPPMVQAGLYDVIDWLTMNKAPEGEYLHPEREGGGHLTMSQADFDAYIAEQEAAAAAAEWAERKAGGGMAEGGVISRVMVPRGEDGLVGVQLGEGIVSRDGMQALEQLNQGDFGFLQPAGQPLTGTIFTEALLSDQVSKLTENNTLQARQIDILMEAVQLLMVIASKEFPGGEGLADLVQGPLENRAQRGDANFIDPNIARQVEYIYSGVSAARGY